MSLTSIQIILLAIILFFLSRVGLRVRDKVISPKTALFWTLIWTLAIAGIFLPATTTRLAEFFGVGRGVDMILYISIALLFYLIFRIYVMIEDLRREITFIVRQIALQNAKISPKNSKKTAKSK